MIFEIARLEGWHGIIRLIILGVGQGLVGEFSLPMVDSLSLSCALSFRRAHKSYLVFLVWLDSSHIKIFFFIFFCSRIRRGLIVMESIIYICDIGITIGGCHARVIDPLVTTGVDIIAC